MQLSTFYNVIEKGGYSEPSRVSSNDLNMSDHLYTTIENDLGIAVNYEVVLFDQ